MHLAALFLIITGGVMEGLFAFPMKFARGWAWENFWGAGSLLALLLVPWPLAFLTIPDLGGVYASAPLSALWLAALFGFGWGCGGIFFGRGVALLGLSLGTSLIMGLIAVGGSLVPLLLKSGMQVSHSHLAGLLTGILIMLLGLIICARAGSLKVTVSSSPSDPARSRLAQGLWYCLAAGILSALVNFALIFGAPIADWAIKHNADPAAAGNAIWAIVFTANYVVNIGYCFYRAAKENTLQRFRVKSSFAYWLMALVMGLLWAGGIVVYGQGASMGGPLGPVFGFPIMLITSILTGNVAGALSGEWHNQPFNAKATMGCGVCCMLLAIVTLGLANY